MTMCSLLRRIALPLAYLLLVYMLFMQRLPAQAFEPTHFQRADVRTAGKPDGLPLPGMSRSRRVWDVDAKVLAPN